MERDGAVPFRAHRCPVEFLDRERRGRHLSAHALSLRREIDEELVRPLSDARQSDDDEESKVMAGPREKAHVGPVIDVLFDRKCRGFVGADAACELNVVAATIPAHAMQQLPVVGAERNQVAATTMIGPEDEPPRG